MAATELQKLEYFVKKIGELPAFPASVSQLIRLIEDPRTSMSKIEEVLLTDTSLTLKTLRMANTAYYAVPGGASTLRRAITFLGLETLKQLVMTSVVFDQLNKGGNSTFNKNEFWRHSVYTAAIAELIAKEFGLGNAHEVFICGLVHDIGKIVYDMYSPNEFGKILEFAISRSVPYEIAERDLSAPRHGEIGGLVAKKWNLPRTIQSAIEDHHKPGLQARLTQSEDINEAVDAVYLANRLIATGDFPQAAKGQPTWLDDDLVLKRIGKKPEDVEKLRPEIVKALNGANSLFQSIIQK